MFHSRMARRKLSKTELLIDREPVNQATESINRWHSDGNIQFILGWRISLDKMLKFNKSNRKPQTIMIKLRHPLGRHSTFADFLYFVFCVLCFINVIIISAASRLKSSILCIQSTSIQIFVDEPFYPSLCLSFRSRF